MNDEWCDFFLSQEIDEIGKTFIMILWLCVCVKYTENMSYTNHE